MFSRKLDHLRKTTGPMKITSGDLKYPGFSLRPKYNMKYIDWNAIPSSGTWHRRATANDIRREMAFSHQVRGEILCCRAPPHPKRTMGGVGRDRQRVF